MEIVKSKIVFYFLIIICSFIVLTALIVLPRTVYQTHLDPTGFYTAIVSYRSYQSFLPRMPGSSSDKPGFVKIIDKNNKPYGEMPLPMLQLLELEWTEQGARIKLIGEWDFINETCWYWDHNGNEQISC